MALLKFILIFILVSFIIRLLFRLLAPSIIKNIYKKAQQSNTYQQKPEGSIDINYENKKKSEFKDPGGEFVDFEEIK